MSSIRTNGQSRPASLKHSKVLLFHYLRWNCWKKSIISIVNSSWPLNPAILAQRFVKAMINTCAADAHQYLDYSRLSHNRVSEVVYALWLTATSWHDTLSSHKCMQLYGRPIVGPMWPLMSFLLSETACSVQKFWFIRASTFEIIAGVRTTRICGYWHPRKLSKGRWGFQFIILLTNKFCQPFQVVLERCIHLKDDVQVFLKHWAYKYKPKKHTTLRQWKTVNI